MYISSKVIKAPLKAGCFNLEEIIVNQDLYDNFEEGLYNIIYISRTV